MSSPAAAVAIWRLENMAHDCEVERSTTLFLSTLTRGSIIICGLFRDLRLGFKVGQISPKWDKYTGCSSDKISVSVHFGSVNRLRDFSDHISV